VGRGSADSLLETEASQQRKMVACTVLLNRKTAQKRLSNFVYREEPIVIRDTPRSFTPFPEF
jgi:hypothetical protein